MKGKGNQVSDVNDQGQSITAVRAAVAAAKTARDTNEGTLTGKARQALSANATYLGTAQAGTTAAEVTALRAQVILLTKEVNALIRDRYNLTGDVSDI